MLISEGPLESSRTTAADAWLGSSILYGYGGGSLEYADAKGVPPRMGRGVGRPGDPKMSDDGAGWSDEAAGGTSKGLGAGPAEARRTPGKGRRLRQPC